MVIKKKKVTTVVEEVSVKSEDSKLLLFLDNKKEIEAAEQLLEVADNLDLNFGSQDLVYHNT